MYRTPANSKCVPYVSGLNVTVLLKYRVLISSKMQVMFVYQLSNINGINNVSWKDQQLLSHGCSNKPHCVIPNTTGFAISFAEIFWSC